MFSQLKDAYKGGIDDYCRRGIDMTEKEDFLYLYGTIQDTAFTKEAQIDSFRSIGIVPVKASVVLNRMPQTSEQTLELLVANENELPLSQQQLITSSPKHPETERSVLCHLYSISRTTNAALRRRLKDQTSHAFSALHKRSFILKNTLDEQIQFNRRRKTRVTTSSTKFGGPAILNAVKSKEFKDRLALQKRLQSDKAAAYKARTAANRAAKKVPRSHPDYAKLQAAVQQCYESYKAAIAAFENHQTAIKQERTDSQVEDMSVNNAIEQFEHFHSSPPEPSSSPEQFTTATVTDINYIQIDKIDCYIITVMTTIPDSRSLQCLLDLLNATSSNSSDVSRIPHLTQVGHHWLWATTPL